MTKRKASESPLQILTRNHNFRKGRVASIPAWCKALDLDLQMKVRDIVHEQMDRDQYEYESAVMAIKTGNPGQAYIESLQIACAEAESNKAWNKEKEERSGS